MCREFRKVREVGLRVMESNPVVIQSNPINVIGKLFGGMEVKIKPVN